MQKVFQNKKEMQIKKTVARLPLPAVLPLLNQVSPNHYFSTSIVKKKRKPCNEYLNFCFVLSDHQETARTSPSVSEAHPALPCALHYFVTTPQVPTRSRGPHRTGTTIIPLYNAMWAANGAWLLLPLPLQGPTNGTVAQGGARATHLVPVIGESTLQPAWWTRHWHWLTVKKWVINLSFC